MYIFLYLPQTDIILKPLTVRVKSKYQLVRKFIQQLNSQIFKVVVWVEGKMGKPKDLKDFDKEQISKTACIMRCFQYVVVSTYQNL